MITGKFDVTMKPLESYATGTDGVKLGRMSIDKTFHGALSATSKGEMLSARSPVEGSAGYVAIEQVTVTLEGKRGSFMLQHYGLMSASARLLTLEVIPDSGTGELTGIKGQMDIRIENGRHYYDFDYHL